MLDSHIPFPYLDGAAVRVDPNFDNSGDAPNDPQQHLVRLRRVINDSNLSLISLPCTAWDDGPMLRRSS